MVRITGTFFTDATVVDFGTTPATDVTIVSATTITADSPAGTGTVDVTVTTAGGTSPSTPADHFTYTSSTIATDATYLGEDTTTEGTWIGVYGSQGYNVINATNGVDYPSYATVTPAGNKPYTWAASTNAAPGPPESLGIGPDRGGLVFEHRASRWTWT